MFSIILLSLDSILDTSEQIPQYRYRITGQHYNLILESSDNHDIRKTAFASKASIFNA